MAQGSAQPLVKTSTRDVPGGKGGRCLRMTTYHHVVPMSRNLGALTLLDPSGPAWPVMSVLYLAFLQFMVRIILFPNLNFSCFYTNTFRIMRSVPNMVAPCSSSVSCYPGMLPTYRLNDFEVVPVAPVITGINYVFTIRTR
jgi:hypothetical protein